MVDSVRIDYHPRTPVPLRDALTTHQAEMLAMAAAGETNKEIADSRRVALSTVKNTFTTIYNKLGARNRAHAIAIWERGFTLIELLIVVAIMGILAAVIIPNLASMMRSATVAAANLEAHTVVNAAWTAFTDTGSWPLTSDSLVSGTYIPAPKADYSLGVNGVIDGASPADNGQGAWPASISWDLALHKWK